MQYEEIKAQIRGFERQINNLAKRKRKLVALCPHEEIHNYQGKDEHYYCVACRQHVGDIQGLWGEHAFAAPYIQKDDPRIVKV